MFIVHVAGHLGKDPETRFTPNGQKVTSFSIAVNQRKGKEDVTMWVRVTVWGDRFDKIMSFLKKGSGVIVTGKMMPSSSYTDKEGRTQVTMEVTAEMIEFSPFGRTDRSGEGQGQQSSYSNSNQGAFENQQPYNEGQFQTSNAPQYGRAPAYGSQTSGSGFGGQQATDDDALPF